MRPNRLLHVVALLSVLCALLNVPAAARAATLDEDDITEDEYEERARVMRITLVGGIVSLRRAGEEEWEAARLNVPLVEGDAVATGVDSRLEIQLDARNFIRLGAETVLRVVTLRDEGVAFSLSEGTATFRLARFEPGREYFEMDAPKTTVAAEQSGLYRLDVSPQGDVSATVRDDGRARIYSETSGFVLRAGRTARLVTSGPEEGDWELASAPGRDRWDVWNEEREQYLAARLRYDDRARYYDQEVWGAEELDSYGDWVETKDYGYVWRPHTTVINHYSNWAPYRYGHWRYCPPYGWTWIPDEDWGWAPYHYGRWVHVNNYWCWAPRGYGYRYRRAWWRPALVAFVFINTSHGRHVAWYPLRHGQRDPRGRFWPRGHDRLSPLGRRDREHLRRLDPTLLRAVSSLPDREFGATTRRARAASSEIAQRALRGDPVAGRLPISPHDRPRALTPGAAGRVSGAPPTRAGNNDPRGTNAETHANSGPRGGLVISRPAPLGPARAVPDRPTGAAARTPGVALGGDLRRTRVFGGRAPRADAPPSGTGSNTQGDAGTGAVTRPARPNRRPSDGGGGARGDDSPKSSERPARPSWRDRAPVERPSAPAERPPSRVERPSAPVERPSEPVYRPEPRPRSAPVERPRREGPPAPRHERPAPSESRPRSEPRQEAPRQAPPRQEAPRQEAPRQEQRSAPRQERPAAPARTESRPRNRDQR
jgi:hypothetical protein